LHPGEPDAAPSGYFAVRGLARAVDRLEGTQATWYFGRGVEAATVQAGADTVYWFVSLLAEAVKAGPADVQSVLRRSTVDFDPRFQAIANATAPDDLRIDELLSRPPLARWGEGPVTVLGDAAHPMLPHTGQGAAQALEDAAALGRAVVATSDVASAVRLYERWRCGRARRIVLSGPRIARITTTRSPIVSFLRNGAIGMIPTSIVVKALNRHARAD
jgi:2-polyprenyl-6-methoxyphenol hydroxylase-like FAD-dependent oxidoreductase